MSTFHCVVFTVSNHKFALPLDCVERVVRAVEVTPLPDTPETVAGVINVQGRLVPVIDLRQRLALALGTTQVGPAAAGDTTNDESCDDQPGLEDQLVIARNGDALMAILANTVDGVSEFDLGAIVVSENVPGPSGAQSHLHGLLAAGDSIIMVRHPSHFLSEEQANLTAAREASVAGAAQSGAYASPAGTTP